MEIVRKFRVMRVELHKAWSLRKAATEEVQRAFRASPTAFRSADRRTKAAVVMILGMVAAIIVNLFLV